MPVIGEKVEELARAAGVLAGGGGCANSITNFLERKIYPKKADRSRSTPNEFLEYTVMYHLAQRKTRVPLWDQEG